MDDSVKFKFGELNDNHLKYSSNLECLWLTNDDGEKYSIVLEDFIELVELLKDNGILPEDV